MQLPKLLAASAALTLAAPASGCDMQRGAELFLECAACHTYVPNNYDKSGPNLHGLFGRKAGTARYRYGYTEAMKSSEFVWYEKTLDRFLQMPARVVPGTKMVYAGLEDPVDRATLICFLKEKAAPK